MLLIALPPASVIAADFLTDEPFGVFGPVVVTLHTILVPLYVTALACWAGVLGIWVFLSNRASDGDARADVELGGLLHIYGTAIFSIVVLAPSLFFEGLFVGSAGSYRLLSPESPTGCRLVYRDTDWDGRLYLNPAGTARLINGPVVVFKTDGPGFDPVGDRDWALAWEGETALLELPSEPGAPRDITRISCPK